MEVSAPPGNVIGTIEQEWSIFPRFKVKDVSGNVILKIEVGNKSNNLSNNTSNEIKKVDTVKSVTFADSSIKNSKVEKFNNFCK